MAALIIFALLFLCGLLNSLFSPSSKLLPFLRSLLLSSLPPPPKPDLTQNSRSHPPTLKTLFSTFDTNGDGFISPSELHTSLLRLGLHTSGDDLINLIQRVDANGDGLIDLKEFGDLYASIGSETKAGEEADREIREAFEVFDGNGDGLITADELSLVLKSLGLGQGDRAEACREMIHGVDLDGDGMVNFEEFKRMMVVDGGGKFF